MSHQLLNLVTVVNQEIAPELPKLKSEKSRIQMRSNLLALSRMCLDLRRQLLSESKELKQDRINKKLNKNNINNHIQNEKTEQDDDV
jgi:hypothetical protein